MPELSRQQTADGSWTLHSERYGQSFHSHHGAISEARHVFLQAAGVAQRLQEQQTTHVLEVGFGTGLNFFLSADLALQQNTALTYTALEQDLLSHEMIASLHFERHVNPELLTAILQQRQRLPERCPDGSYLMDFKDVRLELIIGEAREQHLDLERYHAIYHDAFSPDANDELWSRDFLQVLTESLMPHGILTTYSVKGEVRRCLQGLGLEVYKAAGPPGGKREMLVAHKP